MADAPEPRRVFAVPAGATGTRQLEPEPTATTIPVRRRRDTRERAAIKKGGHAGQSYAYLDIDHGFAWEGDGKTATDEPQDFTPPSWIKRSRRRRVFERVRNELAWVVALGVVLLITALAATAMLGPPDTWGPVLTRALTQPETAIAVEPAGGSSTSPNAETVPLPAGPVRTQP